MKFLVLIHLNPAAWDTLPESERDEMVAAIGDFTEKTTASGELVDTVALGGPRDGIVVRRENGAPAVTDGPYVEAKEHLAGYYLFDCESRERAIELAAAIPDASVNTMEVRPIIFMNGDPT